MYGTPSAQQVRICLTPCLQNKVQHWMKCASWIVDLLPCLLVCSSNKTLQFFLHLVACLVCLQKVLYRSLGAQSTHLQNSIFQTKRNKWVQEVQRENFHDPSLEMLLRNRNWFHKEKKKSSQEIFLGLLQKNGIVEEECSQMNTSSTPTSGLWEGAPPDWWQKWLRYLPPLHGW